MVLAVIFCSETVVMLLLPYLVHEEAGDWHRGIIDAALLLVISAPLLWLLIVDPLRGVALFERHRAQTIIENAAQGILTINAKNIVQSMNRAAETMLEVTSQAATGRPVIDLLPAWTPASLQERKFETKVTTRSGGSRPVAVSISPLDPDRDEGHILMIRDLTEQYLAEQRRVEAAVMRAEKLALAAQIASSVAHELRNPLTSMKMLVQTNREEVLARGMPVEDLDLINQEILRMELSLREFLSLARHSPQRLEWIQLDDVILRTFRLVETRARQQQVELQFSPASKPVTLNADRDHLQQLFLNLAMNSLDAMPSGGKLTVELAESEEGMEEIRVSDTGTGIPPEILGRLFEAFVTSKPTGTGLGLVVSRRLVEEQGGSISAINRPEGGAVFTIRLSRNPDVVPTVGADSFPMSHTVS
ncbi:MAG: fixL 3 [Planctomycetaceae bacterium]|nr:fixL 3 [Planctomycetaceae bacterium]